MIATLPSENAMLKVVFLPSSSAILIWKQPKYPSLCLLLADFVGWLVTSVVRPLVPTSLSILSSKFQVFFSPLAFYERYLTDIREERGFGRRSRA